MQTVEKHAHVADPKDETFRNYVDSQRQAIVEHHYRCMRQYQTVDYVKRMIDHFGRFDKAELTIWEAMLEMDKFIDNSDPDTELPNIVHMFQTAESLKAAGEDEWMQLTGLIHDLGKILYLFGRGAEDGQDGKGGDQWGIAGDTFVVGCQLPSSLVFPEFNSLHPDMKNPEYNTENGIYQPHCGMHNLMYAFGHDEYMYMVLKNHKECTLPQAALDVVRFHSLYCWHAGGAYRQFMTEADEARLEVVRRFQKHDLYTKHSEKPDVEALKAYYTALIDKYIPGKLKW
jgi:inositol oxygenase